MESADTIRLPGPLHRVYRFFISKRTGIGLILAMGAFTFLGTMISQSTDTARADATAYADWLDGVRGRYGGWTGVLDALGMFDVFGSWWFKAVNVLLCISILCCVAHRIPLLWKRATRPQLHVTEGFFAHAGIHHDITTPLPADTVLERVRSGLRAKGYRVLDDPRGPGRNTYADRFRWPPFGTIFAHVAFVIILLGCLVTANTGFSEDSVNVSVGDKVAIGHGTGMQIEATSFSDTYYADGRPKDYVSHLVLYQDGVKVKEQDTRVNEPLRHDGVKFFQASFGFAARMRVTDAAGAVVYEGGVPLMPSVDEKNTVGKVPLADKGVDAYVVTAASGRTDSPFKPGEAAVKVQPTGQDTTIGQEVVAQGRSATIGGLTYTFLREQQYTGLMVSDDPGALWVWIGSTMIVTGMCLTMFFRHRRIWVRVQPGEAGTRVRLASSERHDTAYDDWVTGFVEDLSTDLGATPTTRAGARTSSTRTTSTVGA
ncbi:hypothetical protein ADJ73_06220 [Arsenicicoccus sp. oral taxon 190]|nr:hypothetical protein ADJ73_06220 [Arsenicicoccus sp. oral taxon 190]